MSGKNDEKDSLISIRNLASCLGLADEDIEAWIKRDAPKIKQNHMGDKAVSKELLGKYSLSEDYMKALHKALMLENFARGSDDPGVNKKYKEKKIKILESCRAYVNDLERFHGNCLDLINAAGYESKFMAAYFLFSRIIAIVKMCCLCLEHDHWYCSSQLREIDEGMNLAEYFVITGDSPEGKKDLQAWFRQNYAPKNTDCRDVISEELTVANPGCTKANNLGLMKDLYEKKSKFTHQTYRIIREITKFKIQEGKVMIEKIEYGSIGYQRKLLELAASLRSNLVPCFPTFIKCFLELPLSREDFAALCQISRKLSDEDEQDYLRN